jgi:hypothetical protein
VPIDGTWKITTKTPQGEYEATLVIATTPEGDMTGTMTGPSGELTVNEGEVDGHNVQWSIDATAPAPMKVVFTGIVTGNAVAGHAAAGKFGTSPFSGKRTA